MGSMGFSTSFNIFNILIDRVPSCRILEFCAETFPTIRNSSYARKDVFFLVRVLVQARFTDSKVTIPNSRPYYLPLDINGTLLKISGL
jgi:hypothetical protein